MTEGSANKPFTGDACHRSSNGKNATKNGFVKSHCLLEQPQKYRRTKEKVRPNRQLSGRGGLRTNNAVFVTYVCVASGFE